MTFCLFDKDCGNDFGATIIKTLKEKKRILPDFLYVIPRISTLYNKDAIHHFRLKIQK